MLDHEQLRAFAQRGFVVVPQVVPQELLATASRTIDVLLSGWAEFAFVDASPCRVG